MRIRPAPASLGEFRAEMVGDVQMVGTGTLETLSFRPALNVPLAGRRPAPCNFHLLCLGIARRTIFRANSSVRDAELPSQTPSETARGTNDFDPMCPHGLKSFTTKMTEAVPCHGGQLRSIAERFGIPASQLIDFSANINPGGPPPRMFAACAPPSMNPRT